MLGAVLPRCLSSCPLLPHHNCKARCPPSHQHLRTPNCFTNAPMLWDMSFPGSRDLRAEGVSGARPQDPWPHGRQRTGSRTGVTPTKRGPPPPRPFCEEHPLLPAATLVCGRRCSRPYLGRVFHIRSKRGGLHSTPPPLTLFTPSQTPRPRRSTSRSQPPPAWARPPLPHSWAGTQAPMLLDRQLLPVGQAGKAHGTCHFQSMF